MQNGPTKQTQRESMKNEIIMVTLGSGNCFKKSLTTDYTFCAISILLNNKITAVHFRLKIYSIPVHLHFETKQFRVTRIEKIENTYKLL